MKKTLLATSLIATIALSSFSVADQNLDFNTEEREDSLSEAQAILNNMNKPREKLSSDERSERDSVISDMLEKPSKDAIVKEIESEKALNPILIDDKEKNKLLEDFKNGELNPSEAGDVAIGNKSINEVKAEKQKVIDDAAQAEVDEIIERKKEEAFLKDKQPQNKELAEKFARGEITATQGVLIQEEMTKKNVSEDKAKKDVLKKLEENEKNAIEDSFFDKIKNWFK